MTSATTSARHAGRSRSGVSGPARAVAGIALLLLLPSFILAAGLILLASNGPVFVQRTFNDRSGLLARRTEFRVLAEDGMDRHARVTWAGHLLLTAKLVQLPALLDVVAGRMPLAEAFRR